MIRFTKQIPIPTTLESFKSQKPLRREQGSKEGEGKHGTILIQRNKKKEGDPDSQESSRIRERICAREDPKRKTRRDISGAQETAAGRPGGGGVREKTKKNEESSGSRSQHHERERSKRS